MSRSKHTDPKAIRASRRVRAPRDERSASDLSRRRQLGQRGKAVDVELDESARDQRRLSLPRIIVRAARPGFHHPASKQDLLKMLYAVGPIAIYGLRAIELARSPANASSPAPAVGRYRVPGRIVLFEQQYSPWRLPGLLKVGVARRMERAGAVVTRLENIGATLITWPQDTLRQFMLEDVFLHELGHHVLQHYKGKRAARIARTRDHEAFAVRFAEKLRAALLKGCPH